MAPEKQQVSTFRPLVSTQSQSHQETLCCTETVVSDHSETPQKQLCHNDNCDSDVINKVTVTRKVLWHEGSKQQQKQNKNHVTISCAPIICGYLFLS